MSASRLSIEDRENILANIRKKVEADWMDTPTGAEITAFREHVQNLMDEAQNKMLTPDDCRTLAKFDLINTTNSTVTFELEEKDGEFFVRSAYRNKNWHFRLHHLWINDQDSSILACSPSSKNILALIQADGSEQRLREFIGLFEVKDCEIEKVMKAYETLLGECGSMKRIRKKRPEFLPHIPKYLLEDEARGRGWKAVPADTTQVGNAEAVIRSFKGDE